MRTVYVPNSKTINIGLSEVAKAFEVSPAELERQLALLGWGMVMSEAQRLAFGAAFAKGASHLESLHKSGALDDSELPIEWSHVEAAFRMHLPQIENPVPKRAKQPKDKREGVIYVLHDGVTGLSKIGCTSGSGTRQRSQMASHGSVLVNLLNAKVGDMRAAEAQCHERFKSHRRNGEWFAAPIEEIMTYIATEIDWLEIEKENDARLIAYMIACSTGDMKAAKTALYAPNHPLVGDAPLFIVKAR